MKPARIRTWKSRAYVVTVAAGFLTAPVAPGAANAEGEVNIYSYRQEVLIRPLLDRFTAKSGIKVNVVFAKKGIVQRLKAEGENSPADVVLTVDVARLVRIKKAGLFQPVQSAVLSANVPAQYRDPQGLWFGLSVRARPIFYNVRTVKPSELSTYEALADAKWRKRVCIRSSGNVYNQSLLASMIARHGVEKAEAWTGRFVVSFARKPKGGDRDQIRAVAAGECDVAIANTYYLATLVKSKKESDRAAAKAVRIFWPNQAGRGTHVNISGAGVTKSSKNRANAIKLLEFLAGDEAQKLYADVVNEYPVKPGVPPSGLVASWGTFKADRLPLASLEEYNAIAVKVADRAGWR